jgi:hypothetical protein
MSDGSAWPDRLKGPKNCNHFGQKKLTSPAGAAGLAVNLRRVGGGEVMVGLNPAPQFNRKLQGAG